MDGVLVAPKQNVGATCGNLGVRIRVLNLAEVHVVEAEQKERVNAFDTEAFFGQRDMGCLKKECGGDLQRSTPVGIDAVIPPQQVRRFRTRLQGVFRSYGSVWT